MGWFHQLSQTDESKRGERDVERLDFNHAAFFEEAEIRQPHHGGGERTIRAQSTLRDGNKGQRNHEHRHHRRQSRHPFVARAGKFEGCSHEPVDEWRFAQIGLASHLRHNVITRLEHGHRRQHAAAFFALKLQRPESWQINHDPNERDEEKAARHARECNRGRSDAATAFTVVAPAAYEFVRRGAT